MNVTVTYETQLKRALGTSSETVEVPDGAPVRDVICVIAERRGGSDAEMLVDADGNIRSSLLIFLGEEQIAADSPRELSGGDTVTLMSPISGG